MLDAFEHVSLQDAFKTTKFCGSSRIVSRGEISRISGKEIDSF